MKENDISKMLPDWTLTYVLSEKGNEKIYQAEKESGGAVKYSLIRAAFLPCKNEDFDEFKEKFEDENQLKKHTAQMLNKCKKEFTFLRSMSGKHGWLSLKESYDLLNTQNTQALAVARFKCAQRLSDFIDENGLTEGGILKMGIDICRGLEHAKKIKIIHGSLTPGVIFVDENCRFRIGEIDIDVSENKKLFTKETDNLAFTAPYALQQGLDYTSDTYSVGLIMYYYLNGKKLPFEDEMNRSEAIKKRLSGEQINKPLYDSERITKIVMKACSAEKAERYQTPYLMRKELEECYLRLQKELEEKKIKERISKKKNNENNKNVSIEKDISAVREHKKDNNEIKAEKEKKKKTFAGFVAFILILAAAVSFYLVPKIIAKANYKDLSRYKIHLAAVYYKDTDKADKYEFSFNYDGKPKRPDVVIDKHEKLVEGIDYTVEYEDNVDVGKAIITVRGIGSYKGKNTRTFNINPEDPGDIEMFEASEIGKDSVTLSWSKSENADRYLIFIADEKTEEWGDPVYILDSSVTTMKMTALEPGRKYYMKINGAVIFGDSQMEKGKGTTVRFETVPET